MAFDVATNQLREVRSERGQWEPDDYYPSLPERGVIDGVATRLDGETVVVDFGPEIGLVRFEVPGCD